MKVSFLVQSKLFVCLWYSKKIRLRSSFLILVFILFIHCNPQNSENKNDENILAWIVSNTRSERDRSVQEVPGIPDIVIPEGISSLIPANAATASIDWTDLGTKSFAASCNQFGDGRTHIQRILPTTKLIVEVHFSEDVNGGNLEVTRQGISIPGNLTFPGARTARFESNDTADFSFRFPYSATASGFTRTGNATAISPVTWRFRSNFSGTAQANSTLTEICNPVNGKNQCTVTAVQKLTEEIQDLTRQNDLGYFFSDLFYFDSGGNQYGLFATECMNMIAISAKAQSKEFWFLETSLTLPDIPTIPKAGRYGIDSMTVADTANFDGLAPIQVTVFEKK